jgi:hypothetical protein
MPRPSTRLLLVLVTACAHPDAFPSGDPGDTGPFPGPAPVRLTFNAGQDRTPAWYPDGSGLLYVYDQPARGDLDFCLGLLPPAGGTRQAERCPTNDFAGDSVDAREWPAASAEGRLAWVEQQGRVGLRAPAHGAIRLGGWDPGRPGTVVRTLPYLAPSGTVHVTATHLAWLGDDSLVYVGADLLYSRACSTCKVDTLVVGREIVTLDLSTDPATITIVPGTTGATAVWPLPATGALVYTLAGDSRVFRRQLATAVVDTVWDFAPLGIARDPSLDGTRLLAVVGGLVSFANDPLLGPIQPDSGGTLYLVDLSDSSVTAASPATQLLRHQVPRPDGHIVTAEATDILGPFVPDLFLYSLP